MSEWLDGLGQAAGLGCAWRCPGFRPTKAISSSLKRKMWESSAARNQEAETIERRTSDPRYGCESLPPVLWQQNSSNAICGTLRQTS